MGSYASIINDTSDHWFCKQAVNATMVDSYSYITLGNMYLTTNIYEIDKYPRKMGPNETTIYGVPATKLEALKTPTEYAAASAVASIVGKVSAIDTSVVAIVNRSLVTNGSAMLQAGQEKRYGKYSLSIARYARCYKIIVQDEKTVYTDRVTFNPFRSGATDKSVNKFSLSKYVSKAERGSIKSTSDAFPMLHVGVVKAAVVAADDLDSE